MAHALKYRFSWGDTGGNTRLVEIYEDGFAGTVENIEFAGPQPVTRRMRASRGDEDNIINGQEWQFDIVTNVANRHKFDPLFESSYQDFYGVFKKNGAIIDKGWLKPENLERAAENPFYRITLSFVDGLADLKDIEFRKSDNSFYTGEMTMLEVIKEALSKMGIEIATRDFRIVSNLYEVSQMSVDANGFANDSALRVSTIDTRRFIDTQTGKTKADNCYRVIEKILFNFNVKLKVVNNQYWIVDYNESAYADENYTNGDTFVHEVLWSDLTAAGHTRTAINNHVDLTGKVFRRGGNYSKLQPIKSYDLTFKNKFLGKLPDVTLNDWANWTVAGAVSSSIDADGTLSVRCDTDNNTCTVTSPIFDITEEADREYIKVLFNYVLNQFFGSATGTVNFHFRIDKPFTDGFGFIAETNYFGTVWNDFISPNSIPFMVDNAGADPGSYQLRIVINVTTDAEILFTQPSVKKIVPLNTVGGATTTRDENFVITQANGIKSEEIETFFGDTGGLTDVGRITINGNLTTTWNHLRNEQLPIIEQILKHKLSNRQSHADIIRFDYLDENDIISLEKSIKIGSNYYEIIGLNKEYKQGNSTITVRQLFDPDVVYTLTSTKLRSADGSTTTEPYSGGTGTGDGGGSGGGGDNPLFQSDPIYMQDDFFFDSSNNFNFNNVSTDRTLFNLYNDDLGGTSNLLASFNYDFTNDAFKIVNTDLNLDNNDITNINNLGGGGLPIGVNDYLDFKGTSGIDDLSDMDFGGQQVNEISTTIDGTSTNNQLATAAAVNTLVNGWGLEDARLVDNTMLGDVLMDGMIYIDMRSSFLNFNTDNIDGRAILGVWENTLGNNTNLIGVVRWNYPDSAFHIETGGFQLATGTSVNEIVTTIDGTSTDDQLPTAAAVNTAITAAEQTLSEVLIAGNDAGNKSIINLSGLIVGDTTDASIVHFEDATASVNSFVQSIQSTGENGSVLSLEKTFGTDNGRFLVMGSPSNPEYYFDHSKLEVQPGLAVNVDNINQSSTNGLTLTAANGITLAGGDVVVNNKIYKSGHLTFTQVGATNLYYRVTPENAVELAGSFEADSNGDNVASDELPGEARPDTTIFGLVAFDLGENEFFEIRVFSDGSLKAYNPSFSFTGGETITVNGIYYFKNRP